MSTCGPSPVSQVARQGRTRKVRQGPPLSPHQEPALEEAARRSKAMSPLEGATDRPHLESKRELPDTTPVQLHLFGGPRFLVRGKPVHVPTQASVAAAVTATYGGRGVAQGTLLKLLWRSGTESALRGRLNQTLYDLKQHLGGVPLVSQRDGRCFINLDLVATDLERFHLLLADRFIEAAARLAEKGFMSALDRSFSPDLEHWMRQREIWLKGKFRTVAAQLWEQSAPAGAWDTAEQTARALLTLFPSEQGYLRKRLVALAAQGYVDEARIAFAQFAESARAIDPSWRPSPDISSTLASLAATARRHLLINDGSKMAGRTSCLPLVGREEEVRTIRAVLETPPDDGFQVVSVTGQEGSGKTRLVNEALTLCTVPESNIYTLRCSEDRVGLNYSGLTELWEAAGSPEDCSAFSFPSVKAPIEPLASYDRAQVLEWLSSQMASTRQMILFIDNAQWLDRGTRGALAFMLHRWPSSSVTLIMTGPDRQSLPLLDEGVIKEDGIPEVRLKLAPLAQEALITLTGLIIERDRSLSAEAQEELSAGILAALTLHPGNLSTGLTHAHQLLRASPSSHGITTQSVVAEHLGAWIRERLEGLPSVADDLLSLMLALEREASLHEVEDFLEADASLVIEAAECLSQLGLLEWGSDKRLSITKSTRNAIRRAVSTSRSVLAHHRIAESLSRDCTEEKVPRLAVHLLYSGRYSEVQPIALDAAETAQKQGDVRTALTILAPIANPEAHGEHGVQATLRLGELLVLSGKGSEARQLFVRALQEAKSQGDRLAEFRARLGQLSIAVLSDTVPTSQVVDELVRFKHRAVESQLYDLVPDLLELLLRAQARRGDQKGIRSTLAAIPDLESRLDARDGARLRTLRSLGSLYDPSGSESPLAAEVLESAVLSGDSELGLRAANWLLIRGIQDGTLQLDRGLSLRRTAARLASNSKELTEKAKFEANTAVWYLDTGDIAGASIALQRARRLMGDCALPDAEANLLVNMGELALADSRYSAALDHFLQARSAVEGQTLPAARYSQAGIALAYVGRKQVDQAARALECLPTTQTLYPFDSSFLALAQCRVLEMMGEKGKATDVLDNEAAQLKERFKLGWVRMQLERLRLTPGERAGMEELEDFLHRHDLRRLLGHLRAARAASRQSNSN